MSAPVPSPKAQPVPESELSTGQPQNGSQPLSGYVWGIDGKSTKLAIGWDGAERGSESWLFPTGLHDGERLAAIYQAARFEASVLAERYPPAYVFYEEVVLYSQRPAPILYQACGVIVAAVYEALRYVHPFPVTVAPIPTSDWKRRSVGHGHAKKDDVLLWARRDGYTGQDQDEADAWCIAVAGRRLLEPQPEQLSL
jgi:Holliday junction resolvasome RuvABC endonuclease subunit